MHVIAYFPSARASRHDLFHAKTQYWHRGFSSVPWVGATNYACLQEVLVPSKAICGRCCGDTPTLAKPRQLASFGSALHNGLCDTPDIKSKHFALRRLKTIRQHYHRDQQNNGFADEPSV